MAWYNSNWQHRKEITVGGSVVTGGPHTDFPVLVSVTDTDLSAAQADGDDILFTDSDGSTKLDHELESWDDGTGTLIAWVKLPSLSNSETFYVYYGNAGAANQENASGTWSNGFEAVWHMDGTGDSVGGHTLTDNGTADAAGQIDRARDFEFDNSDWMNAGTWNPGTLTDGLTLSAWLNAESWEENGNYAQARIIDKSASTSSSGIYWMLSADSAQSTSGSPIGLRLRVKAGGTTTTVTSGDTSGQVDHETGTDYLWHGVYDPDAGATGTLYLYTDGAEEETAAHDTGGDLSTSTDTVAVGRSGGATTEYWDGLLDEVRVASAVRSAGWIATEHENQNSPGTFVSLGSEETVANPITLTGSAATVTVAEPAGTADAPTTASASTGTVTAAAPTGSTSAPTTGAGSAETVSVVTPAGAVDAPATPTASTGVVTVARPAGSVSAHTTATGSVGVVAVVGPEGTATLAQPITLTGSAATVTVAEPAGTADAPTTASASTGTVTAAAPAGSVSAPTALTGTAGVVAVTGPAGTAVIDSGVIRDVQRTLTWDASVQATLGWDLTQPATLEWDLTQTEPLTYDET